MTVIRMPDRQRSHSMRHKRGRWTKTAADTAGTPKKSGMQELQPGGDTQRNTVDWERVYRKVVSEIRKET